MMPTQDYVCICGNKAFSKVFVYTAPPEDEVRFKSVQYDNYYREILKCDLCGHFISSYQMDLGSLYTGDYVASNYKDIDGIHTNFKRIISLDPEESDNAGRTETINRFAKKHFSNGIEGRTLLDIGSGLGVFPYAMKQSGWVCTALDPDHNAVKHLEVLVGVHALHGELLTISDPGIFDVITFNKVLEHVGDPIRMLKESKQYLKHEGFVYVELPDAEMAAYDGQEREEFSIDHLHIFSLTSVAIFAQRAGFVPVLIERLQEPSTKYSLRMFLVKHNGEGI
jgi:SAM-dependent methyltransferase